MFDSSKSYLNIVSIANSPCTFIQIRFQFASPSPWWCRPYGGASPACCSRWSRTRLSGQGPSWSPGRRLCCSRWWWWYSPCRHQPGHFNYHLYTDTWYFSIFVLKTVEDMSTFYIYCHILNKYLFYHIPYTGYHVTSTSTYYIILGIIFRLRGLHLRKAKSTNESYYWVYLSNYILWKYDCQSNLCLISLNTQYQTSRVWGLNILPGPAFPGGLQLSLVSWDGIQLIFSRALIQNVPLIYLSFIGEYHRLLQRETR